MSQKSSLPQPAKSVSRVLTPDNRAKTQVARITRNFAATLRVVKASRRATSSDERP